MPPRDDAPPVAPVPTGEARDRFSEILNRAAFGKERVVLTRRGKPLVALVPIEDMQALEALEALEDSRDSAEIRVRMAEWREAGRPGISIQDHIARHGLDVADDPSVSYRVIIEARAQKALDALDRRDNTRVSNAILRLADDPQTAANVKALQGGG